VIVVACRNAYQSGWRAKEVSTVSDSWDSHEEVFKRPGTVTSVRDGAGVIDYKLRFQAECCKVKLLCTRADRLSTPWLVCLLS